MEEAKEMKCAHCREEIASGDSIEYKGKHYCCDACAFEASIKLGSICGSRSTVESSRSYTQKPPDKGR
jgi:hypothetical protein